MNETDTDALCVCGHPFRSHLPEPDSIETGCTVGWHVFKDVYPECSCRAYRTEAV